MFDSRIFVLSLLNAGLTIALCVMCFMSWSFFNHRLSLCFVCSTERYALALIRYGWRMCIALCRDVRAVDYSTGGLGSTVAVWRSNDDPPIRDAQNLRTRSCVVSEYILFSPAERKLSRCRAFSASVPKFQLRCEISLHVSSHDDRHIGPRGLRELSMTLMTLPTCRTFKGHCRHVNSKSQTNGNIGKRCKKWMNERTNDVFGVWSVCCSTITAWTSVDCRFQKLQKLYRLALTFNDY